MPKRAPHNVAHATCQRGNRLVTQSWRLIGGVQSDATPQKLSPKPPSITPQSLSDINALKLHMESKNTNMCLIGLVLILHDYHVLHLFLQAGIAVTKARKIRTADIPAHIAIA